MTVGQPLIEGWPHEGHMPCGPPQYFIDKITTFMLQYGLHIYKIILSC